MKLESQNKHRDFVGDVESVTEIAIDSKDQQRIGVLDELVRENLGDFQHLSGTSLEFTPGQNVVLLSAGFANDVAVRIHKISSKHFEVRLEKNEGESEDIGEEFFNTLRERVTKLGALDLELLEPITADEWVSEMEEKLSKARVAADML